MSESKPIELPAALSDRRRSAPPRVSVLVASYQADRDRVKTLLESITNQPYDNLEVVIIDSSDLEFLRNTAAETNWIRHVPSEPRGVSAGFNEAIEHATGDIYAIIADDDYVTKDRFTLPLRRIDDGADIVYGDVYDLKDTSGELTYRSAMPLEDPDELWKNFFRYDGVHGSIPAATVTFRAVCTEEHRFCEELRGGEDYHLWVRLFNEFQPAYVSEPLAVMRQHDESLSSNSDLMYENRIRAIDDLTKRYPDLREYAENRKRLETYDYGRNLMFDGRLAEARRIFSSLFVRKWHLRAGLMLGITLLPTNHERLVRYLDEITSVR